jgi:hypothetical protein
VPHDQQSIEQAKRDRRHDEQIHRRDAVGIVMKNVFQPCDGGPRLFTIYLATLVWPISMPSLSNSPWIPGAPHSGLAMLISRISLRISVDKFGRPRLHLPAELGFRQGQVLGIHGELHVVADDAGPARAGCAERQA